MPSKKVVAGIVILLLGVLLGGIVLSGVSLPSLNFVGGQGPISISQVNLTQGGTPSGKYLTGTDWDIVLDVRTPQTVSLVLNGACVSSNCASTGLTGTFNGAEVNATSQLYVTIAPGQPIAWLSLTGVSGDWAQAASSSYSSCPNVVTPSNLGSGWCNVVAQSLGPMNVFTSGTGATFNYVFPVTITVTKIGGGDSFTASKTIDAFAANSVTITNPNDPNESLSMSGLGASIGAEGLPPAEVTAMQVNNNWYVFGTTPSEIFQGYNQYWYGGQQNSPASTSSPSSNYNSPGWQELNVNPAPWWCLGCTSAGYYYTPVAPIVGGYQYSSSQQWTVAASNYATVSASFNTNYGQGLIPWLESQFSYNPYLENVGSGMSVNSTTLQINLPTNVFQPTVQLLASTTLVDTVIYQQNNAQFKITNIQAPISLANDQLGSVNVTLQNTSPFQGPATVDWAQNPSYLNIQPNSQLITLQAGQTGTVTFKILGSCPQSAGNDQVTFATINGAGQITSSKSAGIYLSSSSGGICSQYTTSTNNGGGAGGGGGSIFPWTLLAGITLIIVAVVGTGVYYWRRR